ncbi:3-deoxy-D-manno-octulosonic acid transferase [Alcaligenaceae bacterium C4P045]|nr:3-deoxy-D-manno-octulosonic acid transferase [Alcaligenaceae bacterium C4P045]
MRRPLYTLLLRLAAPLIWLWMARRARRAGGEWGIFSKARFGHPVEGVATDPVTRPVWVHAVSLGETRAANPLIAALLAQGHKVLLTHTTATGREEGARAFADAIAAKQLLQTWLPYDFPASTDRFIQAYRPRIGLLIEREVWPNLLASARYFKVPMALVSARFSDGALRQARNMGHVMKEALSGIDTVLAQTSADATRLRQAGASPVRVTGNIKFDVQLPETQIAAGRRWRELAARPVIALASTREGEDEPFVEAIKAQVSDNTLFWLIPRHPQRFGSAAETVRRGGLGCECRSNMNRACEFPAPPAAETRVMMGDTLGEMGFYYAASDVAIIGGSFAPLGGQNLIESCAAGTPVIFGPHTFNFEQAAEDAIAAGAAIRVADAQAAIAAAQALIADAPRLAQMRTAARAWGQGHAGATRRTVDALQTWLAPRGS